MFSKGIDLTVNRGEVLCLIGPSGSGKSTFIRCINHLEKIDGGDSSSTANSSDIARMGIGCTSFVTDEVCVMRAQIGMVFQQFNLFPHMSVLDNVMSGPVLVKKEPQARANERARALLDRVGIGDQAANYPGPIIRRPAAARRHRARLTHGAEAMLFDEPTSALDPEMIGKCSTSFARWPATG